MNWRSLFTCLVYADVEGTNRNLYTGTFISCLAYITLNPRGPWGGSTHIKVL